jgi:hypothetical protein
MSEYEKSALLGLVCLFAETWDRQKADKDLAAAVAVRIEGHAQQFERLKAAFSLYGFDLTNDGVWPQVSMSIESGP